MKFQEIKEILKSKRSNTKYFNKAVLLEILEAMKSDDFTKVKNSNLYKLNGGCYCQLLEIINNYKIVEVL